MCICMHMSRSSAGVWPSYPFIRRVFTPASPVTSGKQVARFPGCLGCTELTCRCLFTVTCRWTCRLLLPFFFFSFALLSNAEVVCGYPSLLVIGM